MNECFSLDFVRNFQVPIKGIIHLGAHLAQEAYIYDNLGCPVIWVEAHPDYYAGMMENLSGWSRQQGYNACISDIDNEEVDFYITADQYASSLLRPAYHQIQNPHAYLTGSIKLKTKRFDTFIKENNINLERYNFLVLDIQGAELKALRSMGDMLDHFDLIATEYSTVEFYEGVPQLGDLQEFLSDFDLVYPEENAALIHGDGLFIRRPKWKEHSTG